MVVIGDEPLSVTLTTNKLHPGQTMITHQIHEPLPNLLLLAGQSNCSGRCRSLPYPSRSSEPPQRINKIFAGDNGWVDFKPDNVSSPSHSYTELERKRSRAGYGICEALLYLLGNGWGAVPCAIGGSAIDEWLETVESTANSNGDNNNNNNIDIEGDITTKTSHYDRMMGIVHASHSSPSNVRTIIWYQGETDALSGVTSAAYGPKLTSLINRLRGDFPGADIVVVGPTGVNEKVFDEIEAVRESCSKVAGNFDNKGVVHYVSSFGCGLCEDGLHLSGAGCWSLALKIRSIVPNEKCGGCVGGGVSIDEDHDVVGFQKKCIEHVQKSLVDKPLPPMERPFSLFDGPRKHKFVNFTYGEISVSSVQDICSLLSLKDGDVIADLGCGTGGVLLSCGHFARKNCIELGTMIGIDLMGSYVEEGRRACEFAKFPADFHTLDFLDSHSTWSSANIVIACSTCFDPSTMGSISKLAESMDAGAKVVTLDKCIAGEGFIVTDKVEVMGSWGRAKGFIHEKVGPGQSDVEERKIQSMSTNQRPLRLGREGF